MGITILLTGFGRFPGAPNNPTAALVARLARRRSGGTEVRRIAHVFATRYAAVDRELPVLIAQHRPDAIVMFGLAARTNHLRIETRAQNRMSTWFPDAGGFLPARPAIEPGASACVGGRAPFSRLLAAARVTGVSAALSRHAGRYVCNYVYWRALAAAERRGAPRVIVFVHVPKTRGKPRPRGRVRRRVATIDQLVRAGEAILSAVVAAVRAH